MRGLNLAGKKENSFLTDVALTIWLTGRSNMQIETSEG